MVLDVEHVTRLWSEVVAGIRDRKPPLVHVIEEATVDAVDGDLVHLSTSSTIGAGLLAVIDNRRAVEGVMGDVFGRTVRLEVATVRAAPAAPREQERPLDLDSLHQELIATFDATPEDVG